MRDISNRLQRQLRPGKSKRATCFRDSITGSSASACDGSFGDDRGKQQDLLVVQTDETLRSIGTQSGMTDQSVEACLKDQAMLDKLAADQKFAADVLKVDGTPTFFINGEKVKGALPFEDMDSKIKSTLKK